MIGVANIDFKVLSNILCNYYCNNKIDNKNYLLLVLGNYMALTVCNSNSSPTNTSTSLEKHSTLSVIYTTKTAHICSNLLIFSLNSGENSKNQQC